MPSSVYLNQKCKNKGKQSTRQSLLYIFFDTSFKTLTCPHHYSYTHTKTHRMQSFINPHTHHKHTDTHTQTHTHTHHKLDTADTLHRRRRVVNFSKCWDPFLNTKMLLKLSWVLYWTPRCFFLKLCWVLFWTPRCFLNYAESFFEHQDAFLTMRSPFLNTKMLSSK